MPHHFRSRSLRLIAAVLCLLAPVAGVWLMRGGSFRKHHCDVDVSSEVQNSAPGQLPLLAMRSAGLRKPGPPIRVGLTPQPADKVTISVSGPFDVRPSGSTGAASLWHSDHLAETRVTATPRGLKIGTREFAVSRLEITPDQSPAVWVDDHQYRGRVQIYRRPGNKVLAVNVLPLEDYVASVVDSEMPTEFGREPRKAQAIVARTYALYQMRSAAADALVDLYATVRSQKYLGAQYRSGGRSLAGESADSREIADETRGLVCTTGGQLFCTYYCAVCGGQTMLGTDFFPDAAAPLQSVSCSWCQPANLYRWEADLPRSDWQSAIQKFCVAEGVRLGTLKSIRPVGGDKGRMPQFEARGTSGTHRLTGADLRQVLNARGAAVYSPRFSIEEHGDSVHFRGSGNGHGVGLCQWGARGMGKSGRTALEIVRHYYPGAQIVVADYQ